MLAVCILPLLLAGDPDEKAFLFKLHAKNLKSGKEEHFSKALSYLHTSPEGLEEIHKGLDYYYMSGTNRRERMVAVLVRNHDRVSKDLFPKVVIEAGWWLKDQPHWKEPDAKAAIALLTGPGASHGKSLIPVYTRLQSSDDAERAVIARRILQAIEKATK